MMTTDNNQGHVKATYNLWESMAPITTTETKNLIGLGEPTPMYPDVPAELPDLCPCGDGFIGCCDNCGSDNF